MKTSLFKRMSGVKMNTLPLCVLSMIVTLAASLGSCGDTKYGANGKKTPRQENGEEKEKKGKQQAAASVAAVLPEVKNEVKNETIDGVSFRVKDSVQLRTAIETCVGSGLFELKTPMERTLAQSTPAPNAVKPADGRFAFLAPGFLAKLGGEKDVVVRYATDLYEPTSAERTSTNANALTANYMSSLALVADVVAYNCGVNAGEPCDCSTVAASQKIVSTCVPHLSEKQRIEVAGLLAKSCEGSAVKKRSAIASFFASTLFAEKK